MDLNKFCLWLLLSPVLEEREMRHYVMPRVSMSSHVFTEQKQNCLGSAILHACIYFVETAKKMEF